MDKELKGLVFEIISIIVLLAIVIPICVNASSEYRLKKDFMQVGDKVSIDISNKGEFKDIRVLNSSGRDTRMNLVMKITKFSDSYLIYLDDQIYDISTLEYTEDEDYQYYNLGIYDLQKERNFKFKIVAKDKSYYDETISYSFYAEGFM